MKIIIFFCVSQGWDKPRSAQQQEKNKWALKEVLPCCQVDTAQEMQIFTVSVLTMNSSSGVDMFNIWLQMFEGRQTSVTDRNNDVKVNQDNRHCAYVLFFVSF